MAEPQESSDYSNEDYDSEGQGQIFGDWKIVDLPIVSTVTGEEEEDVVMELKAKVYRWRAEWKERGKGSLKLLRHKTTGLIRVLARADVTHKCIVNHLIQEKHTFCQLKELGTSNNTWVWAAYDFSDEPQTEIFSVKFTCKEDYLLFKEEFEKACKSNVALIQKQDEHED